MTAAAAPQVQVAIGVLALQDGLVLLGRRRSGLQAGHWGVPGGLLSLGEDLLDGAERCLRDATGLRARTLELGPYANDPFPQQQAHLLTVYAVARGLVGAPVNRRPDDCEGWAWFRWGDWPEPLFQPVASLMDIGWKPGGA